MSKPKEIVEKYEKIADRISELGYGSNKQEDVLMLSIADDKFHLQLDEMLNAPHDVLRNEISEMFSFYNKSKLEFDDDRYVSRFASEKVKRENEIVSIFIKRKKAREIIEILEKQADNVEYISKQLGQYDKKARDYVKKCEYYASLIKLKIDLEL